VRVERHHPVERGEGDRQAVSDQAAAADRLHAARDPRVRAAILLERPAVQEIGDGIPDREVEDRPDHEEWNVQVQGFAGQDRVGVDDVVMGPLVEIVEPEEQRNVEQGQYREHARRRAEDPARDDAPGAA
jgi:hypothetical protein